MFKTIMVFTVLIGMSAGSASALERYVPVLQWGGQGAEDGMFDSPSRMAIDSKDNVCVVDGGNKRIQKFDAEGKFIAKWPTYQADNSSISPCGIAIDQEDNVYVMNNYKSDIIDFPIISIESNDLIIQVFNGNGLLLDEWRSEGGEDHNIIRAPTGFGIDAQQRVYLTELDIYLETMNLFDIVNSKRRSMVTVYSQDGEVLNRWG
ncbi:MAG: hypothetical protein GY850_30925, partial [bacterium]|nr:hypothetical protein [bacterium]